MENWVDDRVRSGLCNALIDANVCFNHIEM